MGDVNKVSKTAADSNKIKKKNLKKTDAKPNSVHDEAKISKKTKVLDSGASSCECNHL